MLKQIKNSKRGFTIIEVVLVLAIAGLIFLMVFLALPALQRSQRDTQRRDKLGEFRTQIVQYQSNNNGRLPSAKAGATLGTAWQNFLMDYMDLGYVAINEDRSTDSTDAYFILNEQAEKNGIKDIPFTDPDGEPIFIAEDEACDIKDDAGCKGDKVLTWSADKHKIYIYMQATCDGESAVEVPTSSTRSVAFRYKLEGAGTYCGNN